MKKIIKIIGAAGAVAAAAALVPYHFQSDKETGEFELGGLLWKLKKEAGEEEDTYTMELLPFIDKEVEAEEAAIDAEAAEAKPEDAVEEPFAATVTDEIVVETADDAPVEEPFAEEDTEATIEVEVEADPEPEDQEAPSEENK